MPKLLLHLIFWLAYWLVYAYTYSRYDGNLPKYLLTEGLQMPARMLATYISFWVLDRWSKHSWWALSGVAMMVILGGIFNRFLKFWYVVPEYFPDATIHFWDLNRMAVDIFDCVLATAVAISARLYFRHQASLRREAQLQREKTEAELLALKNQLQPHFLFNTINNLYALARIKSDKTAPVALQLANLLRFVLYETGKATIPIEQEVKILKDYIALEELRFDSERLTVDTKFDLDNPAQPITPLLLLPLVENAFKHGVSEDRSDAWVRIDVQLKAKKLTAHIENSLQELAPKENHRGIGLANIRRQLELRYPSHSTLVAEIRPETENMPASFRVMLTVSL
ncbi:MAG: histidine kinase [Lewinellaceae bacterium]|nr:histidine kinase [Saprospiraceae bacterium]MCB9330773.1 histidine kinase [Lewinellaceae bacterium]